jgi:hypothetical protein
MLSSIHPYQRVDLHVCGLTQSRNLPYLHKSARHHSPGDSIPKLRKQLAVSCSRSYPNARNLHVVSAQTAAEIYRVSQEERSQCRSFSARKFIYTCILPNKNSTAVSPQANYAQLATATGRRILVPTFADRVVSLDKRDGSARPLIAVF